MRRLRGPPAWCGRPSCGEPDERAARERIGVGRPLAGQIRQEQEPAASRRDRGRLVDELTERDAGSERVAEPAQAAGRRQHHAHDVPAPRHGMAERVQAALGLDARPIGRGEHDAGGAE
jgi:hypothetical protein